jgi:hypothetical protein
MTDLNSNQTRPIPKDREIAKRGQDIYNRVIRDRVETLDNLGKIIAIDIETGNYEIDDNLLESTDRLHSQFPAAIIWAQRIGFNAVYAVGGSLTKVDFS